MDFFEAGIPIGRYFGITVRLHFLFLVYAGWQLFYAPNVGIELMWITGLWLSILLHEFGHAFAARWCDGEADQILLWPLGGLAFCRPAWHPTAHLITTVAGPFVTLVLWLLFWGAGTLVQNLVAEPTATWFHVMWFLESMRQLNLYLLIFNVFIPAFPMDGGRMLRDTLWHFMSAEKATKIAVVISQIIAVVGGAWAVLYGHYFGVFLAAFIFMQCVNEQRVIAFEAGGAYTFSLKERLRRGSRRREFRRGVREYTAHQEQVALHRCATCGLTDSEEPTMDFRVCTDCSQGQEYCRQHLEAHTHV